MIPADCRQCVHCPDDECRCMYEFDPGDERCRACAKGDDGVGLYEESETREAA